MGEEHIIIGETHDEYRQRHWAEIHECRDLHVRSERLFAGTIACALTSLGCMVGMAALNDGTAYAVAEWSLLATALLAGLGSVSFGERWRTLFVDYSHRKEKLERRGISL